MYCVKSFYPPLVMCTNLLVSHYAARMTKLLKVAEDIEYVDLTVSFVNPDGGDDIAGPPVRYHLK